MLKYIGLELKDVITILIAIYGAILSTVIFIRGRIKEKRKLLLFYEADGLMNLFIIRAVNIGFRPITLVDVGLKVYFRYGLSWRLIDTIKSQENLPITLTDSVPATWVFVQADIFRQTRGGLQVPDRTKHKVVGFVRDATGRIYEESKPKRYDHLSDDYNLGYKGGSRGS